jgi:hypothetical protein
VRAFFLCVLVAIAAAACNSTGGGLFRQYEYEEEMYLSLDGSATIYVNSSIAALNALRGTSFDTRQTARIDREAVRQFFTTPSTRVMRVTTSRRRGRQYVHVRLETDDVRTLGAAVPFSWSSYSLARSGETLVYKQAVAGGVSSSHPDRTADWSGDELVAFRVHVPSVVEYHNAGPDNLRRGNIVVWEQALQDRLRGQPLELEVQMQPRSILYRTLVLFASMFAAVALLFGVVIWRIVRAGQKKGGSEVLPAPPCPNRSVRRP